MRKDVDLPKWNRKSLIHIGVRFGKDGEFGKKDAKPKGEDVPNS